MINKEKGNGKWGRQTLDLKVQWREEEEAGSQKSKIESVPSAEPAASLSPQ